MTDWKTLVGYKDAETLVTEALNRIKTAGSRITNFNTGAAARTLVEAPVQAVAELFGLILAVVPQGYAQSATGGWLDLKAAELGLTRLAATKAAGTARFSRTEAVGNVNIPSGSWIRTDTLADGKEYRFKTTAAGLIADGATYADVAIEAEFAGAGYNVGTGAIKNLVTFVSGVETVTNLDGWLTTTGTDDETDAALRARCQSRWTELARGATKAAYEAWAMEVAGVGQVLVDDTQPRGQGTVDVIIMGAAGAPSAGLIDDVQGYIDERRPICVDVLVKAPTFVATDVAVTVYAHPTEGDLATIQAAAEAAIRAVFTSDASLAIRPVAIGEDLYRTRLIAAAMACDHVINVDLTAPAADVAVATGALATLGVLTVNVIRGTL